MRCSPASAARHRGFTLKLTAGARACPGRRTCDGPNGTGRPGGNPGAPEALARPGGPPARLTLATRAEGRPPAANAIRMVRVTAQPVSANLLGSMPSLGWGTFHAASKQETTGKEAESKTRNAWQPNEGLMMDRRLPRISGHAAFALPSGQRPLRTSHGVWPGSDPCVAAAVPLATSRWWDVMVSILQADHETRPLFWRCIAIANLSIACMDPERKRLN